MPVNSPPVSICAVTSTRADYGILSPLLKRLDGDSFFNLTIAATGTHLLDAFGHTIDEILSDGFIPVEIPILDRAPESPAEVSRVMGNALSRFGDFFADRKFSLLLVLGDRYEIEAVCCAAVNARIPIAHLHGGETTAGAVDECYRHAITKMSSLHFPACEAYRQRILQMGEAPENVYAAGALAVENIRNLESYPFSRLAQETGLPLERRPYALVTFHPVTQEEGSALQQVRELIRAMEQRNDLCYLITKSNADEGGSVINAAWDAFSCQRENCRVTASLGMRRYITALKHSRMMIGNSSSGILEAPVCGIPTVNIGDRQKGRLRTPGILDCAPECAAILKAMERADSPDFRESVKNLPCPYGNGDTSFRITEILKTRLKNPIDLKKEFRDLQI